jgi:hypothetical protein
MRVTPGPALISSPYNCLLQVRLCLVVNKIDRLIQEWRMQPHEAYQRIRSIITHVNMVVSAFQSERFISEADAVLAYDATKASADVHLRCALSHPRCALSHLSMGWATPAGFPGPPGTYTQVCKK